MKIPLDNNIPRLLRHSLPTHQGDDTQETFKGIKDLIPEEQRLEAVTPGGLDHQPTSASLPTQPRLPAPVDNPPDEGDAPQPVAGDGYPEGHSLVSTSLVLR